MNDGNNKANMGIVKEATKTKQKSTIYTLRIYNIGVFSAICLKVQRKLILPEIKITVLLTFHNPTKNKSVFFCRTVS